MKEKQDKDPILLDLKATVHYQIVLTFEQGGDGVLKYQGIFCVPTVDGIQERILKEAYSSRHYIHLGSAKIYHNLGEVYWFEGMKKGIVEFVGKCQIVNKLKWSTNGFEVWLRI